MSELLATPPDPSAGTGGALPDTADPGTTPLYLAPGTAGGSLVIGKVASPVQREATSDLFHFWVPPDALVEKTQIVRTGEFTSRLASSSSTVLWMRSIGRAASAAWGKNTTPSTAT